MTDRKIGLFSTIFLCLNNMVGSGLFLLPGQVAGICGNWGLLVYAALALMVMSIGWCYAKCAGYYSRNGGAYLYAKEAFGDFIGFEVGLMRWVVSIIAWASLTSGFVVALGSIWPKLAIYPFKQVITIGVVVGLSILNLFGSNLIKHVSNVITISKAILLLVFVIFGLFAINPEYLFTIGDTLELPQISSFGAAALIIFYAFSGFEALPVVAGEMKDPQKIVPKALMIAIICCSILYFTVQAISIGTLGPELANTASPIVEIASIFGGPVAKLFVFIAMLISIGGVTVAASFVTPRSCSALAQEQQILSSLVTQNKFGAPYIAIIVSAIATSFIALSGSFVELVTISVVSRFVQHITTALALFVFEKRGTMNPFSNPYQRAIPVIALFSIFWLLSQAESYQIIYGLGALVIGIPLYFLQKRLAPQNVLA